MQAVAYTSFSKDQGNIVKQNISYYPAKAAADSANGNTNTRTEPKGDALLYAQHRKEAQSQRVEYKKGLLKIANDLSEQNSANSAYKNNKRRCNAPHPANEADHR